MNQQEAGSYYDMILPDETSRYVYRILAVKLIFEHPEAYGFYVEEDDYYRPIPVKNVKVSGKVDSWGEFANERGLSYKLLKYFNPWLRQTDLKNRKNKTYILTIPESPYDLTYQEVLDIETQITR
jgi:hypothetical protein